MCALDGYLDSANTILTCIERSGWRGRGYAKHEIFVRVQYFLLCENYCIAWKELNRYAVGWIFPSKEILLKTVALGSVNLVRVMSNAFYAGTVVWQGVSIVMLPQPGEGCIAVWRKSIVSLRLWKRECSAREWKFPPYRTLYLTLVHCNATFSRCWTRSTK